MTIPVVPQWLEWSKILVEFDHYDRLDHIPQPVKHALVVDPQVGGFRLRKVPMDGAGQ